MSVTPTPSGIHLPSELWVDDREAHEQVDRAAASGELDEATACRLRQFVDDGYMTFSLETDPLLFERLIADVDRAWDERPSCLAYAYDSPPKRMRQADPATERRPRYRIHDLHGWSEAALELYLDPTIFRHVELIYRRRAVAIQSLYFEFGSQQQMHRDPVVVPSSPPSYLLAAWISLEDIDPRCGPLQLVPGSHRLPYYEVAPGEYMFDASRMGEQEIRAGIAWDETQCHDHGLEPRPFLGRRGEVLLWHHSLLHGGSAPLDPSLTRRSFVVHFSSLRHYRERGITLQETSAGGAVEDTVLLTTETMSRDGRTGFRNPLA